MQSCRELFQEAGGAGQGLWHQERGGTMPGHRQGPGVREDEVSWRDSWGG